MKKMLALLLALSVVFAFAACAKKGNEQPTDAAVEDTDEVTAAPDDAQTTVPEETEAETEAKKYELVTYGRISATVAPEGWEISDDSADWRIVYVKSDAESNVPTVQLTTSDDDVETLVKSVTELKDDNDEKYTKEEITVAGIDFVNVVPELGMPAMYATVDGQTLVVTYTKDVDLQSEAVADIVASAHIAAE